MTSSALAVSSSGLSTWAGSAAHTPTPRRCGVRHIPTSKRTQAPTRRKYPSNRLGLVSNPTLLDKLSASQRTRVVKLQLTAKKAAVKAEKAEVKAEKAAVKAKAKAEKEATKAKAKADKAAEKAKKAKR